MFHIAVLAVLASQTISVAPATVRFNHLQTVEGKDWPVIEFCERKVRLKLESGQNELKIGTAKVRTDGTFTRRWRPRASKVGAGRWKLVVRMRCESGQDGSANFIKRSRTIRIRN
jgi:hypothetical protein